MERNRKKITEGGEIIDQNLGKAQATTDPLPSSTVLDLVNQEGITQDKP